MRAWPSVDGLSSSDMLLHTDSAFFVIIVSLIMPPYLPLPVFIFVSCSLQCILK